MSTDPSSSSTSSGRISAQEAAKRAAKYLQSLVPNVGGIRVEETEVHPEGDQWRITLSYEPGDEPYAARTYKLFLVDIQTGEVLSMRMRKG